MKRSACPLCGGSVSSKSHPTVDGATIVVSAGVITMIVHKPKFKLTSVRKDRTTNER
jgi:hypothetical protein